MRSVTLEIYVQNYFLVETIKSGHLIPQPPGRCQTPDTATPSSQRGEPHPVSPPDLQPPGPKSSQVLVSTSHLLHAVPILCPSSGFRSLSVVVLIRQLVLNWHFSKLEGEQTWQVTSVWRWSKWLTSISKSQWAGRGSCSADSGTRPFPLRPLGG